MIDIRLSKNFRLHEFVVSNDHPGLARLLEPSGYERLCLELLCRSLLQPIRDRWGRYSITSGLRSDELNDAVDGYENSDHLYGIAGDGYPREARIKRVYKWIVRKNLPYRQCIFYPDRGMIHLSMNIPGREYNHEHWTQRR